ncbi:MAG: hypothetical protein V4450_08055 [Bacteroidota bacterium]
MKKYLLILVCLPAVLFTACKKELSDNFTTYTNHPLNDTVWVRNLVNTASIHDFFDASFPNVIVDSFNAVTGATLHYGDSLEIEIKGGTCIGPGTLGTPQGNVRIEILQLKRKGDFIKTFRPTTTANGSLLESGGGVFIRMFKDDKELTLATNSTIKIKFSDIDTAKTNMQAFYGKENFPVPPKGIDTAFSWVRDYDTSYLPTWSKPSNNPLVPSYYGYELNSKNLRWITADRYIDSTQAKTKVTAILSPNYTNKNTAVFAVFAKQKTVVSLKGDYPSRSFFANNIPLKSAIKLVSVSKIGSDFYLGVKDISSVATVTSYTILPEKKSLSDILNFLNNL